MKSTWNNDLMFDPGIDISFTADPLGFVYGTGIFGPAVENRTLDSIRGSLMNPDCKGPETVYAIAMDVGKNEHRTPLLERNLLYGVVAYASGRLGREPIRSQGHIHKESASCRYSTPEIYEIWNGSAIIYMQQAADDDPGVCYAVHAHPGDVVIVPPYWAHATISADPFQPLVFGAWCVRDYGFEYDGVRRHHGIAWFPVYNRENKIEWIRNAHYRSVKLIEKHPETYNCELGIEKGKSIYRMFEDNPDAFLYVADPVSKADVWRRFIP